MLRAAGAATAQVLTGPALEGAIAVLGSLAIGVPVGLGLGMLAARALGVVLMIATSALALGIALVAANRVAAASVLREP